VIASPFATFHSKIQKKIYIPVDKYPGYNFMGMIIGPRGNTHRRLEAETNCKICIKGRVSLWASLALSYRAACRTGTW
jgi:hypothetical protein